MCHANAYLYLLYSILLISIGVFRLSEDKVLTLKYHLHYIFDKFHFFSLCGTKVPSISYFAGRVARREAFDRNCNGRVASMRWTRGPPDQERRMWLNKILSDSSQPSITRIITAEITSNRWTSRDITTTGSKSNGRSEPKRLFINASRPLIRDRTIIRQRRRFVNRRAIAIVDRDESIRSNG